MLHVVVYLFWFDHVAISFFSVEFLRRHTEREDRCLSSYESANSRSLGIFVFLLPLICILLLNGKILLYTLLLLIFIGAVFIG